MELIKRAIRKTVKLKDLKFDHSNPNQMSSKEEEALGKSLERFGYVYEIVVDKKTMIVADGAHRLKDLLKKGVKEEEVKLLDFKDDAERRLFRQITKKVQGTHSEELDAEEYKKILANSEIEMQGLVESLATSEQEILNCINQINKEDPEKAAAKVDQLYQHTVTCPFCKRTFEKKKE